jgi:NAD(P)-dependent dehydrogenase (short-subunit alcohol dehydrogenase family)
LGATDLGQPFEPGCTLQRVAFPYGEPPERFHPQSFGGRGDRSARDFSAYASAKAAPVRFSETLADEVRSQGITVNCIAPGAMKTAMLRTALERAVERVRAHGIRRGHESFRGRRRLDGEGADPARFLSSPAARGITGKSISAVWDRWEC